MITFINKIYIFGLIKKKKIFMCKLWKRNGICCENVNETKNLSVDLDRFY